MYKTSVCLCAVFLVASSCGPKSKGNKDVPLQQELLDFVDGQEVNDTQLTDQGEQTVDELTVDETETDVTVSHNGWKKISLAPKGALLGVWSDGVTAVTVGEGGAIAINKFGYWVPMLSPTDKKLHSVFGQSIDKLYAVGEKGTILSFDGKEWVQVNTQIEGIQDANFKDVWGQDEHLYVVGDAGFVLHKKDTQWQKEQTAATLDLECVWGHEPLDVYAAGNFGTIMHKIGSAWTSTMVTSAQNTIKSIRGLSASAIWAVGTNATILQFEAGQWIPKLSNDVAERPFNSLCVYGNEDIWIVGGHGALVHYNGKKWNVQPIKGPYYANRSFYDVACWTKAQGEQGAWAVGEKGAILKFNGKDWIDFPSWPTETIKTVVFADNTFYAFGTQGLALRRTEQGWSYVALPEPVNMSDACVAKEQIIVAGQNGAVVTISPQNDSSQIIDTGIDTDWSAVCRTDSQEFILAGKGGVLAIADNSLEEFTLLDSGVFHDFTDCAVHGEKVYLVGNSGTVVTYHQGSLVQLTPPTMTNINAVTVADHGVIYCAGDNGLILMYDESSTEWEKLYEQPGLFLYGIAQSKSTVIAVGWAGTVVQIQDKEVSVVKLQQPDVLNAVSIMGEKIVVVGNKGAIYEYDAP